MNSKIKKRLFLIIAFMMFFTSIPQEVKAHRAYFMQVFIDESQLEYVGNVIKDSTLLEKNKIEADLWDYDGTHIAETNSENYESRYSDFEGNGKGDLLFTFPSKAIKRVKTKAKNNASGRDEKRAYDMLDTLIVNLNDILLMLNNDKSFETIDELLLKSHTLVGYISQNGTFEGNDGTKLKFSDGKVTVYEPGESDSFELATSMKKGYTTATLEDGKPSKLYDEKFSGKYDKKTDEISIADMIMQANYTYIIEGHSSADAEEYSKPGTLEIKLMEFTGSCLASLKSLLGLREIEELVFNQGLVGSSKYHQGLMPAVWFQKSIAFHVVFQVLIWIALGLAIIKLAFQRLMSTINTSARVSLMNGIKDLIVAGFMLMGVFASVNVLSRVNLAVTEIFFNTVPEGLTFSGSGPELATFGGVLIQLYYFLITLYLNVIYIVRSVTLALLIASGPLFVGSIAFQTKSKNLFETWGRHLIANIFLQSFHGFILSFFLAMQMSTSRGIELAVISILLIPASKAFKSFITNNSTGDLMQSAGAGMAAAGGAVAGGLAGGKKGGGKSDFTEEGSTAGGLSSKDTKANVDKMKVTDGKKTPGEIYKENKSKALFKNSGNLSFDNTGKNLQKAAGIGANMATGAAKLTAGAAVGMAFGGTSGGAASAQKILSAGAGDVGNAAKTTGSAAVDTGKKTVNTLTNKFLGKDTQDILKVTKGEDGNVDVYKDATKLKNRGLENATSLKNGNTRLHYDPSKLGKQDRLNVEAIQNEFKTGNREGLEKEGISDVYTTNDGRVAIEYNEVGKEKLGHKEMATSGGNVIETKNPNQELGSKLTYSIGGEPKKTFTKDDPTFNEIHKEKEYTGPNGGAGESVDPSEITLDDIL